MAFIIVAMAFASLPVHADLMGIYFTGTNFDTRVGTRCDSNLNFSWAGGGPFGMSENFTIRWHGWLHVPVEGTWNFTANTDDGVRLYIDGTVVINNFVAFAGALNGSVYLTAGPHWIQYEFLEVGGSAATQLVWNCSGWNGGASAVIAPEYLSIGMTPTAAIDTTRVMTFYSQPANTGFAGSAGLMTADGMHWIQLTPPQGGQTGTFFYDPQRLLKSFRLRCDLFIGDGTSPDPADGVSFCYGPLNWGTAFGDTGGGTGLIVRNSTYTNDDFDIIYNGVTIQHVDMDWTNNRWTPVEIVVEENGLCTVLQDNNLITATVISAWNPQANWTVGIGARTGGAVARHYIDNLYVGTSEPFAESVLRNNPSPVGGSTSSVSYNVAFNEWLTPVQVANFAVANVSGSAAATVTGVSAPSINVSQNFTSAATPGTLSGNATVTGGYLRLTEDAGGQKGNWSWAPGVALPAFHMSYRQEFVAAGTPADGMNVVYGPDASGTYGVQGPNSGLAVSFDTYNNGQEGTPCIRIKYNGVIYSRVLRTLHNQGWQTTEINVTREGLVSVTYGNVRYGLDIPLPGWNPQAGWQFGFTAYTGGSTSQHRIDDLQIQSSTYAVTLGSLSGQGTVRLNVAPASATLLDFGGSRMTAGYTAGELYSFDFVAPTVTGVNVVDGRTVDVSFNEAMGASALTAANYYLSGSGIGTLTEHPNSVASMGSNTYRLTWTAGEMLNGGDITVTVLSVQDALGNAIGSSNTATDSGAAIGTAPVVSSVSVQGARLVDVEFSEPLGTGATTAANYTLSGSGMGTLAGTPDSAALLSGNTYRLTWNAGEMRQDGDITVAVNHVTDGAGNTIGAPNSGTDSGGGVGLAPSLTDAAVQTARTINVTFDEAMNGSALTAANYTVGGAGIGLLNAHPDSVAFVSGTTYRLTWTAGEMVQGGDISVVAANVADLAGNPIGASNNFTHVGGGVGIAPAVASVSVIDGHTVRVRFNEAMAASTALPGNFQLSGAGRGSLDATPSSASLSSADTFELVWSAGEMVNLADIVITASNVTDTLGNQVGSSNTGTAVAGGIGTAPSVTGVEVQGPLVVDVTFSEPMDMGVTTAANYRVSGTGRGTLQQNPSGVSQFGPTTYRLTWAGGEMRNGGDIVITVQNAKDVAGNVVSGTANSGTDAGAGIGTAPSTAIGSTAPAIVRTSFGAIVQFSEPVTGFDASDLNVANASVTGFSGQDDTYAFVLNPTGQGLVTVDVAAGVCTDLAGNPNTVALQLTRTYDTVSPQPVLTTTASNPTTDSPIPVTVTFAEDVVGFDVDDIDADNATAVNFSGSGASYTFDLVPSSVGTVRANVAAGACTDVAGNTSTAAAELSRSFLSPRPTVVIAADTPTNLTTVTVTVTFSLPVTGFEESDVVVTGGSVSNFNGSGAVYTFDVTIAGDATVEVPENVATAAGGHLNFAQELTVVYDGVAPELELTSATLEPDYVGTIHVTATFDEPVEGFEASDIAVTNGAVANFLGTGADYTFDIEPAGAGVATATVAAGAAEDAAGNAAGGAALSRTLYDALALESQPEGITIPPDGSHVFSVTTTGGIPPLGYQWSKDGVDIIDATEATYAIENASAADEGVYECLITDSGTQNVVTAGALLTVSLGLPVGGIAALGLLAAVLGIGGGRALRRRK